MLSRRPGSDRAIYEGRLRSFIFSPGRMRENMYEDRFANDSSGSRFSDFSLSSASDQFRYDAKSPSSQDTGYHSPPVHQLRDVLIEDQPKILNEHSDVVARRDLDGIQRPQVIEHLLLICLCLMNLPSALVGRGRPCCAISPLANSCIHI